MDTEMPRIPTKVLLILAGVILLVIVAILFLVSQLPTGDEEGEPSTTQEENSDARTGELGSDLPSNGGDSDSPANVDNDRTQSQEQAADQDTGSDIAIARVGEETIYQSDLFYYVARHPGDVDDEVLDSLRTALFQQSAILQGAADEGIITLDNSFYNRNGKDMEARAEALQTVQQAFEENVWKSGSIVMIFMYNSAEPPMGYDAAKELAFEKLSVAYERVQSGELSMQEAALLLESDEELYAVDPALQGNTFIAFEASGQTDSVIFDEDVNDQILALEAGQTSDILTGRNAHPLTGEIIDVFYAFARVDEDQGLAAESYEEWVSEVEQRYDVETY